jgi:hypothetical protein
MARRRGRIVVVGGAAAVALSVAGLAAAAPPPNDALAAATPIGGASGVANGTNLEATKEPGEPAHAGNSGGRSIWFRWTAPADGQFRWSTNESDFDTLLGVYQGSAVGGLTLLGSDDDSGDGGASALSFRATNGVVYLIAVDGFEGKAGRVVLRWRPAPANDNFRDATPISGVRGSAAARAAGATREAGDPSATESIWFRWTAPASGRVTFALERGFGIVNVYTGESVALLTPAEGRRSGPGFGFDAVAGTVYSIAVSDAGESIVLGWGPPPSNDTFAGRILLSGLRGRTSASNVGAFTEGGGRFPAASIWYRWRAPSSRRMVFDTNGSSFDTVLGIYTGRVFRRLRVVAQDDDGGSGTASRLRISARRGVVYTVVVGGYEGSAGSVRLRWRPAAPSRG